MEVDVSELVGAEWTVEQNWSSMSACLCSPDGPETVPISALTDAAVLTIEAAVAGRGTGRSATAGRAVPTEPQPRAVF